DMEPEGRRASLSVTYRQAVRGGPSMHPPRLLIVSSVLLPVLVANDAQARPRFSGMFGAMLGVVGGMAALHHHRHAYARSHSQRAQAAGPPPAPPPPPPNTQPPPHPNRAPAAPMATNGPTFWPQLADDAFDYIFWPSGKDDRLWAYGYDDIVGGAL